MAISFGLPKFITEHPIYNFCIALPFVCAFYITNSTHIYLIPIFDYELSKELSMLIDIGGVTLYYAIALLVLFFSVGLYRMTTHSKAWYFGTVFLVLFGIFSIFYFKNVPRVALLHLTLSVPFLIFDILTKNKFISIAMVMLTAGLISLFSFMTGILWLESSYLFPDLISAIFGLKDISNDSYKLGAAMLISIGYVIYYTTFAAHRFWHTDLTPAEHKA